MTDLLKRLRDGELAVVDAVALKAARRTLAIAGCKDMADAIAPDHTAELLRVLEASYVAGYKQGAADYLQEPCPIDLTELAISAADSYRHEGHAAIAASEQENK